MKNHQWWINKSKSFWDKPERSSKLVWWTSISVLITLGIAIKYVYLDDSEVTPMSPDTSLRMPSLIAFPQAWEWEVTLASKTPTQTSGPEEDEKEVTINPQLLNSIFLTRDIWKNWSDIRKLSLNEQIALFHRLKNLGLLLELVSFRSHFDKIDRAELAKLLFSGWVDQGTSLKDVLKVLAESKEYSSRELFDMISRALQSWAFLYLWILSQNPYALVLELLREGRTTDISLNIGKLEKILTSEQIAELRSKLPSIEPSHQTQEDPSDRTTRINDAILGMMEVRDFSRFSNNFNESDQGGLDKAWILTQMVNARDYISILEQREFFWLTQDQIYFYAQQYFAFGINIRDNSFHRWLRLLDKIQILDPFIPFSIQSIQNSGSIYLIFHTKKLREYYWKQRLFDDIFNIWGYTFLAQYIWEFSPSRDNAILLADRLTKIPPADIWFSGVSLGQVWRYIKSLWG